MKKLISMLLTFVLLLTTTVAPVMALTDAEMIEYSNRLDNVNNAISQLQANGQESSDEIYSVYIDLTDSPQGSVASTYATAYEVTTINTHQVWVQQFNGTKHSIKQLSSCP